MNPPTVEVFTLALEGQTQVSVSVDFARLALADKAARADCFTMDWRGTLARRDTDKILNWMVNVFSDVATRADRSLVFAQPFSGGRVFVFLFEPGQRPECVEIQ